MSLLRRLAGQTVIYGLGQILSRVLNLILTPIFTDPANLNQGEYGTFTQLYAIVAFFNVLLTFGMETTFFRFIQDEKDPDKIYHQAFTWVALLAGSFLLLGMGLATPLAQLFGYAEHPNWIRLLTGIIALDALSALPMARLRYRERAGHFTSILIINAAVTVGLNLLFFYVLGIKEIEYILLVNLIASAIKFVLALWKNTPKKLGLNRQSFRPMFTYGFFIMIAGFAGIMNETFDRAAIPYLWPDGQLFNGAPRTAREMNGIYGAMYKLAMLINLAIQAFRYAVEPFFFREAKEKDSPETFARIFHFFMIAALIGFLVIGSFAREIVGMSFFGTRFVGEQYWEGLPVVPILLLAYVFMGAYLNMSIWFKITKQVRFAIVFTGVGALITLLFNLIGVKTYGFYASAWATLVCYLVMCMLVYLIGQRYYPIPYRLVRLTGYLLLFLAAYLINRSIGPTNGYWLAFIGKSLVCLAAMGILVLAERFAPSFK